MGEPVAHVGKGASRLLFAIAMAGLGLGVDPRALRGAAPRVALATVLGIGFLMLAGYVGSQLGWLPA